MIEATPTNSGPGTSTNRGMILVVDDEPNVRSAIRRLFHMLGYSVQMASNGSEALDLMCTNSVDVVISDMRMPGLSGAELLASVAQGWPNTVRILLTGYSPTGPVEKGIERGEIDLVLEKPWSNVALEKCVTRAVLTRRVRKNKSQEAE